MEGYQPLSCPHFFGLALVKCVKEGLMLGKSLNRFKQKRSGDKGQSSVTLRGWRAAGFAFLALAIAGCAAKRSGYDVPEVPLPAQFSNTFPSENSAAESSAQSSADTPPIPDTAVDKGLIEWWRFFGNRELEELIDRGVANNPDVRIATLRVAQAKARADQARAGQLPEISAPLLIGIQAPGGTVGSVPNSGDNKQSQKSYQASVRGSWRLDVWGEQSALAESANLQLWRAAFERDNTQRNLAAALASNYVEYASLNDRLQVARELESVLAATLPMIERRVEVGDATLTELEQQRAAIFGLRATIPNLEQQREDVRNAIAFMVGTVPGSLKLSENGLDSLGLPAVVPGLPAALLLRRPDVRMAEARMLSADADVDVARARILPPVDLSAQIGYSSVFLGQLFQPQALFWNAVTNLTASIFDGGKRSSEKEYSQAVHEEMVETYIRTIYQAMREVEGSLATIRLASRRLDAQEEAMGSAKRAWEISSKVYVMGGVDYMTLLDTERTYYRYLDEYQHTRMDHLRGYVTLFQALGGGVKSAEVLPGRGGRPSTLAGNAGKVRAGLPPRVPTKVFSAEGVEWAAGRTIEQEGNWQVEEFYQVELTGLYHRATIGAAWRDLRARYPSYMDTRVLRPRLSGRIEDSADGQEAWYRLYVAKFSTIASAEEFCIELLKNQQRCRVVSSRSDETVASPLVDQKTATASRQTIPVSDAVPAAAEVEPKKPAIVAKASEALVETEPKSEEFVLPPEAPPGSESPVVKRGQRKTRSGAATSGAMGNRLAYTVQLGAYTNLENAAIAHAVWQFRGREVYVGENKDADGRAWYSVRTGVFAQRREGVKLAQAIRDDDDASAVVVPVVLGKNGKPAEVDASRLLLAGNSNVPVVPEPPEAPLAVSQKAPARHVAERHEAKPKTAYVVQLGAFSTLDNATVSHDFWRARGYDVFVSEIRDAKDRTWYAVRTGVFNQRRDATALALTMGRKEKAPTAVVLAQLDKSGKPESVSIESRRNEEQKPLAVEPAPMEIPLATVNESVVDMPVSPRSAAPGKPIYTVQLDAFSNLENAAKSVTNWRARGYEVYVAEFQDMVGRNLYAVRTGEFLRRREASTLVRKLGRTEGTRAALVQAVLDGAGQAAKIDISHLLSANNLISNGR